MKATSRDELCQTVLDGLRRGDFSRLEPYFMPAEAATPPVLRLLENGCFEDHPEERAEALTCACFLGAIEVAERLLAVGVPPDGGMATGLNAFHWAANRGQLAAVQLLLRHGAPLEIRNSYGGTVLGGTVWAAVHEPRSAHPTIIEELLRAGADVRKAAYPTGDKALDALLERYGAAVNDTTGEPTRNLVAIRPFFIVKDLQVSVAFYRERLGFQLDFQGPNGDVYYAGVSREGAGIMLKAIVSDVLPCPNHTRHPWARWDAYIYTLDPDTLFEEFRNRGVSFVKELSFIDDGLWGFEITDADGYVIAFFRLGEKGE